MRSRIARSPDDQSAAATRFATLPFHHPAPRRPSRSLARKPPSSRARRIRSSASARFGPITSPHQGCLRNRSRRNANAGHSSSGIQHASWPQYSNSGAPGTSSRSPSDGSNPASRASRTSVWLRAPATETVSSCRYPNRPMIACAAARAAASSPRARAGRPVRRGSASPARTTARRRAVATSIVGRGPAERSSAAGRVRSVTEAGDGTRPAGGARAGDRTAVRARHGRHRSHRGSLPARRSLPERSRRRRVLPRIPRDEVCPPFRGDA